MKLSCCCGLITGFLLALLCAGGVYYYFYCQQHPEAPEESMAKVEQSWEKTKNVGDQVISTVKPYVKSAPDGKEETPRQ